MGVVRGGVFGYMVLQAHESHNTRSGTVKVGAEAHLLQSSALTGEAGQEETGGQVRQDRRQADR